jgi:predicted nucleic acid-binding protein
MARKADRRCLLDTSAVIYKLHGHTLQKAAVEEAVVGGTVEVPVFVRMEYLRGVVVNLIDLHSLIKESVTVGLAPSRHRQRCCRGGRGAGHAGGRPAAGLA